MSAVENYEPGSVAAAYVQARRAARPQWTWALHVRERVLSIRHRRTADACTLARWAAVRAELFERGERLREPGQ